MKQLLFISLFFIALSASAQTQNVEVPGGHTATENEYDKNKVKERSEKAHKDTDKITNHNNKARDYNNKQAEKDRKEKLGGKKRKEEEHKFNF